MLRQITHGAQGDIIDAYTSLPWPTLCEAVSCLRVELRPGEVRRPDFTNHFTPRGAERKKPRDAAGFVGGADGTRTMVKPCVAERTKSAELQGFTVV